MRITCLHKNYMFKERHYGLSTDSVGVLGSPSDLIKTSGFMMESKNFAGLEMIAWLWTLRLAKKYKEKGIEIIGLHGKTGGVLESYGLFDSIKLLGLNRILLNEKKLIKKGWENEVEYILLHHPKIKLDKVRKLILEKKNQISLIMFENGHKPGAIATSTDQVITFKDLGVKAGLAIDFAHSLVTEDGGFLNDPNKIWELTMNRSRKAVRDLKDMDTKTPIIFHMAIGEEDCIPKEMMTKDKMEDIADILKSHPDILVIIENQQKWHHAIKLVTPKMIEGVRDRNKKNFDFLVKSGVIIA